jgi:hypothetical protein
LRSSAERANFSSKIFQNLRPQKRVGFCAARVF